MAARGDFHAEVQALLRDRLLDTAREIVTTEGWTAVTMARIASEVGISRQGLYNQIGNRQQLGELVLARETDRFLAGVESRIVEHDGDPWDGLLAAVDFALREAAENGLIKAILAGGQGMDGELLALLATRPEAVLNRAVAVVAGALRRAGARSGQEDLETSAEIVVRLTLSHLLQPTGPVDTAVRQIRSVLDGLLPAARH